MNNDKIRGIEHLKSLFKSGDYALVLQQIEVSEQVQSQLSKIEYSDYPDWLLSCLEKDLASKVAGSEILLDKLLYGLNLEDKIRMIYRVKGKEELYAWLETKNITVKKIIVPLKDNDSKVKFLAKRIKNIVNLDFRSSTPRLGVVRAKPLLQGLKITIDEQET